MHIMKKILLLCLALTLLTPALALGEKADAQEETVLYRLASAASVLCVAVPTDFQLDAGDAAQNRWTLLAEPYTLSLEAATFLPDWLAEGVAQESSPYDRTVCGELPVLSMTDEANGVYARYMLWEDTSGMVYLLGVSKAGEAWNQEDDALALRLFESAQLSQPSSDAPQGAVTLNVQGEAAAYAPSAQEEAMLEPLYDFFLRWRLANWSGMLADAAPDWRAEQGEGAGETVLFTLARNSYPLFWKLHKVTAGQAGEASALFVLQLDRGGIDQNYYFLRFDLVQQDGAWYVQPDSLKYPWIPVILAEQ